MGRVVDLVDANGKPVPSIISIDRQTNEITDLPVRRLRIPEKIGNTELTEQREPSNSLEWPSRDGRRLCQLTQQERELLRAGLPLKI